MIEQTEAQNQLSSESPHSWSDQLPKGRSWTQSRRMIRFKWAMFIAWTIIVIVLLNYLVYRDFKEAQAIAIRDARVYFYKDEAIRRWVTSHGGVYVPIDERTPPNPYLDHIPERDIATPSGRRLTLMNPAYAMRQIKQDFADLYGIAGHLTSLNLLRPENAPDEWEREALLSFTKGRKEATEFTEIDGQPYLRLMRPLFASAGCLKCHSGQVSKAGDLRGGISISMPMTPLYSDIWDGIYSTIFSLGLLWGLGIGGIGLSARSLIKRSRERDRAVEELQKHHDLLEELVQERTSEISYANDKLHREIAERIQTEKALRESEANLKAAQRIARLGRWELDLASIRLRWSDSVFEIFGIDPAEFGASYEAFLEAIHPDDREMVNQAYLESLENRTPYEIEHRLLMKDGRIKWVSEVCQTDYDQKDQAIRSVGIVQDITERKLIENAQAFLLRLGLSASGEDFFEALARYLADTLSMDYVCIDRLLGDCLSAQTVAIYSDGRFQDNVAYTLQGTPCGEAAGKTICCFPKDVRHLFPKDEALQEMAAESYVGTTLWSPEGKPIGLIAVIGRKPLKNSKPAESLLKSVSVYAAGELGRRDAVAEIRHLSSFPELNPNPILEINCKGEILYINKAAQSILSQLNLADPCLFFPADIEDILRMFEDNTETQIHREVKIDGLIFGEVIHFTPEFDSVRLYAQDISVRKKAEEEISILSRAVEQSPAALVITDIKGNIEYANPKFFRLTGYEPQEVVGKNPRILKSGVHSREFYEKLWSTILSGNDWRGEICNKKKNGELYWLDASISPFRNSQGEITHFLSIKEEITERKKAEIYLKQAKENAEEASCAKSEFLANMSHEIRTPLNGIIGMTELLLDTPLDKVQNGYASTILTSMESLLTIINDILDFSKIEAGRLLLESTLFDLEKVVEEAINLFRLPAAQKNVELIVHYVTESHAHFLGDPGRLRQILANLAGNAVKFTHQGYVLIDVYSRKSLPEKECLYFIIQDTGIGIPSDKLDAIFEKFSQADSSTTRMYGGTGLGLSICKQLVEMMGGSIEISSEEGKGTTVTFWLELPTVKEGRESIREKDGVCCESVLIVDDNEINRKIYGEYLTQWNIRYQIAASGEEAIAILRGARETNESFELAIIDHQMPDMDGEALGKAIQADVSLRGMRMIMFSSVGDKNDEQRMKRIGFESYWIKPVTRSVFFTALQNAPSDTIKPDYGQAPEKSLYMYSDKFPNLGILLVEDNKFNQEVALGFLERFGCHVEVAENGREALEKWEKNSYDLMFMDVHMPVMDGFTATREIRQREKGNRSAYIVAMTANAMKGDREKCLEAGMDDYIAKPLRMKEIRNVLEKYCSRIPGGKTQLRSVRTPANETPVVRETSVEENRVVFDATQALESVNGNFSRLLKLIEIALNDIPTQIRFLKEALENSDKEAAERRAHTIKGEAANIGAQRLRWKAHEIEQCAASGDLSAAAKEFTVLQEEFRQAREAMEKMDRETLAET